MGACVVAGVSFRAAASVFAGALGAVFGRPVVGDWFEGRWFDDGASVVVVDDVVVVSTTVVVVLVEVVDGMRTDFGVTATLLRGPLSPPTTATIQQRDETGGEMASFVSVRPFGATLTLLRSTVITVSIGALRVSAARSASSASSFSCELRLLTHSTRYDSGVPSSVHDAFMTRLLLSRVDFRANFFGCTTSRFFAGRLTGFTVVVVAIGKVVAVVVVGATVTSGEAVVVGDSGTVVTPAGMVVVATGSSVSTYVDTANALDLFAVNLETISELEIPGNA